MFKHVLIPFWNWLSTPHKGWLLWTYITATLAFGVLLLIMLTKVPPRYRKTIVVVITFLGGLYFALEFLLPHQPFLTKAPGPVANAAKGIVAFAQGLTDAAPKVAEWQIVIGSFALLLGIWNLFSIHGKAIARRSKGWINSLAFFVSFFAIILAGFLKDTTSGNAVKVALGMWDILFFGFLTSLQATMFSLIAFYIVSAAYRAFRIRSTEAGLMMAAAAIIMLGLVPIGVWFTSWIPENSSWSFLRLENIMYWLLTGPNMTVQRAIGLGVAVGALATGLRIWLSLERGSFFDRQL